MRTKSKRAIVLFSTACLLGVLAGCGGEPAPGVKMADRAGGVSSVEITGPPSADDARETGNAADTGATPENAEGKWHVLAPEVAAAIDADFTGKIWRIAEGSFSIAETAVQILEDGSLASSSPSSNADIPDSQLIHVVCEDDTYFYIRTIHGNGESCEDTDGGFGDLQEQMSVEMKGWFENDVFYATEVRIVKNS